MTIHYDHQPTTIIHSVTASGTGTAELKAAEAHLHSLGYGRHLWIVGKGEAWEMHYVRTEELQGEGR